MKDINMKQLKQFRQITRDYLSHWEMDGITEFMIYEEYVKYFEEKGVKDIISFVKWCVLNDEEKSRISATIAHDLNGMRNECFLPRTSGYTEALKKEVKWV